MNTNSSQKAIVVCIFHAVEAFKLAAHQASYDSNDSTFESEDEY